jgi:hypothetical protein
VRRDSRRPAVFNAIRKRLDAGVGFTYKEVGQSIGMSGAGVWGHVQRLVGEGRLVKRGQTVALPGVDLSGASTDALRDELARRGVTMDALDAPSLRWDEGRACAANHCQERVRRGMLMCREHWFKLPAKYRSDIMNAWSGRHVQAYQEAVEAARNFLGGYTRVAERVG